MKLLFAPIQGQTDHVYRQAHHRLMGGVDEYFTPFVRWEREGIRNKDLREVDPQNNKDIPVTPQIIMKDRDEMCYLCDQLQDMGWNRIDLNMGCPFPLQTHAGRGAGLLAETDRIEHIVLEIQNRKEVQFSVKMRSGMTTEDEGMRLVPMLNEAGLRHLTLHPRLGKDQYKGSVSKAFFEEFYKAYKGNLIWNGDLKTRQDIHAIEDEFPEISGVMIGRGLLERPTLCQEYKNGTELPDEERKSRLLALHDEIFQYALTHLQGESQILSRMQEFWCPLEKVLDKKIYKRLTKCGNLKNYSNTINLI